MSRSQYQQPFDQMAVDGFAPVPGLRVPGQFRRAFRGDMGTAPWPRMGGSARPNGERVSEGL
ncbi:hypothetical protein [Bradyrhizobium sp. WSM471]